MEKDCPCMRLHNERRVRVFLAVRDAWSHVDVLEGIKNEALVSLIKTHPACAQFQRNWDGSQVYHQARL